MRLREQVLVVMAKYPTPGTVKTRLGLQLGHDRACALYRAFLSDIATRLTGPDWTTVWAVDPPGARLQAIVGAKAICIDQDGNDLGERMWHAFESLFARGAQRVVMIGADAPHLSPATVAAAFDVLRRTEVCIVPTRDGGYCLVGLSAPHDLFRGIEMGRADVCAETRARTVRLGLALHEFDEDFDIDEPQDLATLERLLADGPIALPATRAVLSQWRSA